MKRLPREARDGIMRVWLEILKERHPEVAWMAKDVTADEDTAREQNSTEDVELLAA